MSDGRSERTLVSSDGKYRWNGRWWIPSTDQPGVPELPTGRMRHTGEPGSPSRRGRCWWRAWSSD